MKRFIGSVLIILAPMFAEAQVGQIKSASASYNNSGGVSGGGGDYSSSSGFVADLVFNVMFGGVIQAQQNALERKEDVPGMISLDIIAQAAAQPSSYYIIHPRFRFNWGIFSTDYRINYLIEEDINGPIHIRTNDWQILQLNIVNTREFTARIGGGIMQEAFEGYQTFGEWTMAVHYQPFEKKLGGFAEYRGAEVRKEFNIYAQYRLFDKGIFHGFTTAGVVYQRYYRSVDAWGLQGGMILRVY